MKEFLKKILSSESDMSSKRLAGIASIMSVILIMYIIVIFDIEIKYVDLVRDLLKTVFIGGMLLLGVSKFSEGFGKNK
jgi:hypothetical protein